MFYIRRRARFGIGEKNKRNGCTYNLFYVEICKRCKVKLIKQNEMNVSSSKGHVFWFLYFSCPAIYNSRLLSTKLIAYFYFGPSVFI